ncbi:MAG: Bifunctional purine biosynthesis protein PurH [Candidatus Magasanikbacteria bacterium GW2011_GWA2_50_22]|uniref:Bifunctional purine biosynthesis protein PurH n=3 Tax=Parcubacteria group TaxID=1794811 RepID=A0A0G1WFE1_9BACT|nr:MAG: Bifunctional purine biosynthesis protein PurH [Candidatus Magasanikbacteria bacterium GW2011_GWA2_50_22]
MTVVTLPMPKRAIISVSDKTGIKEFAQGLVALGWEIISTGGTAKFLTENGIKVTPVADVTKFPEIMNGRVKTLHPAILAGILADQSKPTHLEQLEQLEIRPIDLVVVNLYPFEQVIQKNTDGFNNLRSQNLEAFENEAIENIDIGGPTMLRAAAKNFHSVAVVVDPHDYGTVLEELKKGDISLETKKRLATKVFAHTAKYDGAIANYFHSSLRATPSTSPGINSGSAAIPSNEIDSALPRNDFPDSLTLSFKKISDLRYGENPHQTAAFYRDADNGAEGIAGVEVLQGKELSFNNILDANAALNLIQEFDEPTAAVIKHNNPCGCAVAENITDAFTRAWDADPLSAFGGIVALNRTCTPEIAEALSKVFIEIVLAPDFTPESLELFKSKPNLRLLCLPRLNRHPALDAGSRNKRKDSKRVNGGLLVQDKDESVVTEKELKMATKKHPSKEEVYDMLFAWKVTKHCKSNAIVLAHNGATVGLGLGQTSRVGSVKIAIAQAMKQFNNVAVKQFVCASDAFFPFRDSVDELAKAGVTAIIQPGGSKNDGEAISAADEHNISMAFTGIRVFRH